MWETNMNVAAPIIADAAQALPPPRLACGIGGLEGDLYRLREPGGLAGRCASHADRGKPAQDVAVDVRAPQATALPHRRQNRETSGISLAHCGQRINSMPHLGTRDDLRH